MNAIWAIAIVVLTEMIRRKDFYVLFVLTALITLVIGSVNIFGDDTLVRSLKEICLLLIWLSSLVIAITATTRQVAAEKENRTIFPLLAKPVTRGQLLAGKFLGCWIATGMALLVFYVFFGVVAAAREHAWPLAHYFQAIGLHWVALAVVIALALLASLVFSAPSASNTICFLLVLAILYLGQHLNVLANRVAEPFGSVIYAIYFLIPHLEFAYNEQDLVVHAWPLVGWQYWAAAIPYYAAYTALFLFSGWLLFRRRALN